VPYERLALSQMQVVVVTDLPLGDASSAARCVLSNVDPTLPFGKISRMEDLVSASIAQPRFNMLLIIGLALSAAVLAAVGVYGLVTYSVTRRTVEMGLRAALGAKPRQAFLLVVGTALRLVLIGVVTGVAGTALGRRSKPAVRRINNFDPASYAAAILTIVVVGLGAAMMPALRASDRSRAALRQ
jgi:putative ABC transport system permease protein